MIFRRAITVLGAAALSFAFAAATSSPAPGLDSCCGDADGNGVVTPQELEACFAIMITANAIVQVSSACDCNHDGVVSVDEILTATNNSLAACPGSESATPTLAALPTVSPTPGTSACAGDCNGDGRVTVGEILTIINVALGALPVSACSSGIPPACWVCDLPVDVVGNALKGCPAAMP